MASDEDSKSVCEENFEWNVENEIRLFEAIIGHKPVGINKHFHMACISENFENLVGKPVSSDAIWKHLGSMFDLAALDKKESFPFPNEPEEFSLPEAEFSDLIKEKIASKTENSSETKENSKDIKVPAKVIKDLTPGKECGSKKDKKSDAEETGSNNEGDRKESAELENENKRGKTGREEKIIKRRGFRGTKEKKLEEDSLQSSISIYKREEEELTFGGSGNKKDRKQGVGKRSLRSRADDSFSNKSLTPPPSKRGRRI